ncbi:MAG: 50S ribosomal protein L21 [Parcubacteria group bacterium QH_9_35_7]|nr:MAG: 50S ribosomal protein L21 [Parcubacteria group bacterium QH_9_35_7]
MFAVIETGGKQYQVQEGDTIKVEKLEADTGEEIDIDQVLLVSDKEGEETEIGTPYLENETVTAEVTEQGRHDKVEVVKFKRKNRYKKKYGHKQPYTEIEISSIS